MIAGTVPGGARMAMEAQDTAVADLVFALSGTRLPADHDYELWREIVRRLPWLERDDLAAVHPLRTSYGGEGSVLLARRAKLVLRLARSRVGDASALAGCSLDVGDGLVVGAGVLRPLQRWATLYAQRVASDAADDAAFGDEVARWLSARAIRCGVITGRPRRRRAGAAEIRGWSVVLHDVAAADSLRLQAEGIGGSRALGWGLFVPHKSIAAVS